MTRREEFCNSLATLAGQKRALSARREMTKTQHLLAGGV